MITRKKGDTRRPEYSLWELSLSVRCSDLWGSPRRWLWPRWRRPPASPPWACSGPHGQACARPAGAGPGWCCTWTRDTWHVMRSCVTRDNTWTPRHSASSDTCYVSVAEMSPQTGATRTCTEMLKEKTLFIYTCLLFLFDLACLIFLVVIFISPPASEPCNNCSHSTPGMFIFSKKCCE